MSLTNTSTAGFGSEAVRFDPMDSKATRFPSVDRDPPADVPFAKTPLISVETGVTSFVDRVRLYT
jgi:hypothetical protein